MSDPQVFWDQSCNRMDCEQLSMEFAPGLAGDVAIELALTDLRDALRLVDGRDRFDLRLRVRD